MIDGKKVLALVPARGGSKRLPDKNKLPLVGKPLIAWTIEAALMGQYVDRVHVSTDDEDIASISKQFGGEVPELRPEHLSSDTATTESVLFYILQKYGEDVEIIVLLQPTSPLRTSSHIDEALELFVSNHAESVVSVTPCEHSPLWANTLPKDHSMGSFLRPEVLQRSQDLDVYYRLNGAIYIFDVNKLKDNGKIFYSSNSYAYIMDNMASVDIDNVLDFELASLLISKQSF
ncbi:acylneuraminate cytidylyltransferase family protein [Vibrio vulnificus]|uniref:acylneuraminate cytidylyltransferase family protein n=1 Tax=Vibrio vulnificus TaxID=672 RepID=UPI003241BDE8